MKDNQQAPKSFAKGKSELENIRQKLENDDIDIDLLEDLIDRSTYLIEYLSAKLRKIEDKIDTSDKK